MGGDRSLVRQHGLFVLGAIFMVGAGFGVLRAFFPEADGLRPLAALFAVWSGLLVTTWLGMACYVLLKTGLQRFRR